MFTKLMFRLAFDATNFIAVGVFSGGENSDADFQAYIASFDELDAIGMQRRELRGAYVLVVDPENPRPDALWRKRIADASANIRSNPLVSLVSASAAIRSVVTAINWIRPPRYEIKCHENVEMAAAWIQSYRNDEVVSLIRRLERECRGTGTGRLARTA